MGRWGWGPFGRYFVTWQIERCIARGSTRCCFWHFGPGRSRSFAVNATRFARKFIAFWGLSAALIPRLRALPHQDAQVLLRQTLLFVVGLFSLLAVILVLIPSVWFALLAPGLHSASLPPTGAIIATALAIPLAAASGVTTAGLNSQHRFLLAGCGTLFFNAVVIGALIYGQHHTANALLVLGIGIAGGATARFFSQLVALPRGWLFGPLFQTTADGKFLRSFVVTALAASLMLLVPVIIRALASTISPGAIAAINYATKLVELPVGVLVTSLATVALVRLSAHHGKSDVSAARHALHVGLRRSLSNAVGAGALIAYFAGPFVDLALGHGAMSPEGVARVVNLTQVLMAGLPFLAMSSMAMAELNARENPGAVLKATVGCLMFLPVIALPGVLLRSEATLAWAIVVFQVIHALWLARSSGIAATGGWGWCDRKLSASFVSVGVIVSASVLADWVFQSLSMHSILIRGALGVLAIAAVVVLPQRYLFDSPPPNSNQL